MHFLAQLGNAKRQASKDTFSQTSELNIWCIYSLLEEHSPKKGQLGARLTEGGGGERRRWVKYYLGNAKIHGNYN